MGNRKRWLTIFLQDITEANIGRKLRDVEIKRLAEVFCEDREIASNLQEIFNLAIEKIVSEDEDWGDWDEMWKDTPIEKMSGFVVV
ncbi:hypothetical protein A2996_00870 [Candidatus Campbellbacteria bacterium RIFCSPLOWO2_01_FULL_34_15]|uniref:Uncharacterized protein n=2 Tax=Candidatus Campbelliibacteriota TaxID=1752727 RepID=A0A1F5EMX2_9BACT|nr:MAG: hypothetical protein A2811_00695 [Candidatus Campbellbacteria bacterium RIFCSPHIGHO2_01_FULL_34_10]OGD68759.1 MAG: hypothetical protein A2996_00870 [Candidatus Campbellbacteria bacterium RIFCSPLOWO2_01_FULL_34_15]